MPGIPLKIICNLNSGGTNPYVIQKLRSRANVEVRHSDRLHSKITITDQAAVVGSANYSKDGLGFSSEIATGWIEAAFLVSSNNSEYATIRSWFWDLWLSCKEISNQDIIKAKECWDGKTNNKENQQGSSKEKVEELREQDLFKSRITGNNKIRMASSMIEEEYSKIDKINKYNVRIPAYVSYLLWTFSGKQMETNIPETPVYFDPQQVLDRAKSKSNQEQMIFLIDQLANSEIVPNSVRSWAKKYQKSITSA
nr:phospholipase D family protein [Ectothiorhodospira haloalkaliphila]